MNSTQTSLQKSPDATESQLTIRQLSTGQQNGWIKRILERLTGIYGRDFTYKWEGLDPEDMLDEWADTLGGFRAEDIASALKSCRAQPKPPNLPEFAALCRQNMNTRQAQTPELKLTTEERVAAAKVADAVASTLREKAKAAEKPASIVVNGIAITPSRQWALNLMRREAHGELVNIVASDSWREALGFESGVSARDALAVVNAA